VVSISTETPAQVEARLTRVIRLAHVTWFDGEYGFREMPLAEFPAILPDGTLACVRDDATWSILAPATASVERFKVFRFHFPPDIDNSGFVGWLAGRFKQRFGTGVFVVCGQNSMAGGIYDYWGVPVAVADDVMADVKRLMVDG